ncbi:MAG: putative fusaric acid resistance protein [Rhizobacter sp.]|nr:putative fusaric acid resistance protein [Rhizobacter sp.]
MRHFSLWRALLRPLFLRGAVAVASGASGASVGSTSGSSVSGAPSTRWPASWRLPKFTAAEMLFSAKSFAAAMLAIYITQWAGLPRPFWAMLTSYVVAQPLAGAVRSKGLFRVCGTFVGSTVTVLMVPALANAPELLAGAMALWVAACLYLSLLDRTPRSYVFMLAGYTAALIGFPSVDTPLAIFDTASARVEEITIGILCATLVHSVVFPAGLKPVIVGLLDRSLGDARRWFADLLGSQGRRSEPETLKLDADRRRLAADITQLRVLSTHVPFDTGNLTWTLDSLRGMQDGITALTPMFSAVEDRLLALEEAEGSLAADVTGLLHEVAGWLEVPTPGDASRLLGLRQSVRRFADAQVLATDGTQPQAIVETTGDVDPLPPAGVGSARPADADPEVGRTAWTRALRLALAIRLEQLIDGWLACTALRGDVDAGLRGEARRGPRTASRAPMQRTLHTDRGMAALSAFAAFVAIGIACVFWMTTGWAMGSAAAMMAAVFCSFFATMDDPVPMIHSFLRFTLWSIPISLFYVLVAMPMIEDVGMLAIACAPVFLLIGCWIARPATGGAALAVMFGILGTLAAHDTGSTDFASFANAMLGEVAGIVIAAQTTLLIRSVGADWAARRIQRATWRDLAELAGPRRLRIAPSTNDPASSDAYAARMLDRIGLLAPRIAASVGTPDYLVLGDALRDLRIGVDIATMQQSLSSLPSATAASVSAILADLAVLFRGRGRGSPQPSTGLAARLDATLASLLAQPLLVDAHRPLVAALVGLRRNLFREAPGLGMPGVQRASLERPVASVDPSPAFAASTAPKGEAGDDVVPVPSPESNSIQSTAKTSP